MPDLRTELMKLENLKFDDDVQTEEQIVNPTNTSLMATIWQYVHNHPRCTYVEVMKGLGTGQSDTSTRLTQMYNAGKLNRDDSTQPYKWFTTSDSYERKVPKRYKKRVAKPVVKKVKVTQPTPGAAPKSLTKYDVNELLSTMSIIEARALYDKLKELFGG